MDVRVSRDEFLAFDTEGHRVLEGVPLLDVSAIDLPQGGPGRTIADVRALLSPQELTSANPLVRALFAIRAGLGRVFGWDREHPATPPNSFTHRLSAELRARSLTPVGTSDGPFRLLYVLERESLAEIQNRTVHAFIVSVLRAVPSGYRLYWGVYVQPVSRFTGLYMALIEPFRRFVVYPAIFRRIRRAWSAKYPGSASAS